MTEITAAHALGAGKQFVHRPGDRSREREPHDQRDRLDDQEQTGDDREEDQEDLAEVVVIERRE